MIKIIWTSVFLIFALFTQAQEETTRIPLIGSDAPSFTAVSTAGTINFPSDYPMKWKILFSHPADFTPVCTTELLELAAMQDEMKKLGVNLVVVSVDALETHNQWIASMQDLNYKNRETKPIKFPLVADVNHDVSKKYGMIHTNSDSPKDVRGVFIVDPKDKIRAIFFYPMAVGRNMEEIKRTVVALQTADKQHVYTPANWNKGDDLILPFTSTKNEAKYLTTPDNPDYYQVAWYLNFKKAQE